MKTTPSMSNASDFNVDARIREAAIHVAAEQGVSNLDVASICARAGVTEERFHQRWPDVAAVLIDALEERGRLHTLADIGSLHDELVDYVRFLLHLYSDSSFAAFTFYLMAAVRTDASLGEQFGRSSAQRRVRNRIMIERAVARGELPSGVDGDAILDGILGWVLSWGGTGSTPSQEEIEAMVGRLITRAERLAPASR
jgi:AcrR family transcriptional regulator